MVEVVMEVKVVMEVGEVVEEDEVVKEEPLLLADGAVAIGVGSPLLLAERGKASWRERAEAGCWGHGRLPSCSGGCWGA